MRWRACCSSEVNHGRRRSRAGESGAPAGELQEKVATISGSDAKNGCWRRPISGENGRPQAVERSGRRQRRRAAESADASGGHERSSLLDVRRAITEDISTLSTLTRSITTASSSRSISCPIRWITCVWRITIPTKRRWIKQQRTLQLDRRVAAEHGQELAQFHGRLHHHPSPRHQRRAAAGTEPGHLPARKHPFAPAGGRAGHPRHQNETYSNRWKPCPHGCAPISTRPIRRPRLSWKSWTA